MSARIPKIAPVAVVVLAFAAVGLLLLGFGSGTPRAAVPKLVGEPKRVALARIERHNLTARIVSNQRAVRRLPARYAGQIVHQNFRSGITLPEGSVVRLTIYPKDEVPGGGADAGR
jgi:beta-lactam-binding protein with PASTA domain